MIEKTLIIDILKNNNLTQEKIMQFVSDYVFLMKEKHATGEELSKILLLIQTGVFNIQFAAEQAAVKLNYNLTKIQDKQGFLIDVRIH